MSNNGVTLKTRLGVVNVENIALSCTMSLGVENGAGLIDHTGLSFRRPL